MATAHINGADVETRYGESRTEIHYEKWIAWPVSWTAIWVGALAALCAVLVFGLIGIALGAHLLGPENRVVSWSKFGIGALIFSVCGAFFAFAIGGWIAGKIAGIWRSEPAMLHGAVVWLVAVPLMVLLGSLGAASFFGSWYAGLAGAPAWAAASAPFERPEVLAAGATQEEITRHQTAMREYQDELRQWREDTPKATRNSALGAVTALLLGLVGSVIGGWMASGEPMNFTHFRTRTARSSTM
jgi:uncharacterized membrane protein YeaQ/YmgE (transglycosylase-associated protein family)